jgi:Ala-tRNA(Pro) deacylase
MPLERSELLAQLDRDGITYRLYEHQAVFTCEDADPVVPASEGAIHAKNLFLRDKPGRRHWLLVAPCEKPVDLKQLSATLGAGTLSLGSPERLLKYLGVTPGAVTLLALVNDAAHEVELLMDRDAWTGAPIRFHPLVNTATLVMPPSEVERFLGSTGHRMTLVDVPTRGR